MTEDTHEADLTEVLENEIEAQEQESAVQPEPEAEAVEEAQPVEIPEDLQPVSAWKEDARTAWEALAGNAEHHDLLRQLSGQFNSDYKYRTEVEQERANLAQQAEYAGQFYQLANQYPDVMRGRNPVEVIGELLYYGQQLQQNPQATIAALAQQSGIDLNALVQEQPYVDDYTRQLQGQIGQMQQQWHNFQTQQQEAQQNQIRNEANAFQYETDAEGNLLRPHLQEVMTEVLNLIKSGTVSSYQEAYDKACWMNDNVRQKLIAEEGKQQSQQRQQQAEKAKAAKEGQPKRGKSSVTAPKGVEDLKDAMDKAEKELAA